MYARVLFEIQPPATEDNPEPENQRFDLYGDPNWILETFKTELNRTQAEGASIGATQVNCDDDLQKAAIHTKIGALITEARTPG